MRLLARALPVTASAVLPRRPLDTGWQLASQAAAAATEAPPSEAADWLSIDAPLPAAAAMAAAGRWSFDGPVRRFDGEVWWYRLAFDAPSDPGGACALGFDGLATLCEVRLNGRAILHSRNMFRRHEVDVSGLLRERGNELLLRFEALDSALASMQTERRPRPRWRTPMVEHAQLRWLRTSVLGRTPGWSPPAPVVGPWQGIWLATRPHGGPGSADPTPRIEGLQLHSQVVGSSGRLDVRLRWAGAWPQRARVQLSRGARVWQGVLAPSPAAATDAGVGDSEWLGSIEVNAVERWWPHTHGEPALYALRLVIGGESGPPQAVALGHVGFRSVVIDRGTDDHSDGQGFALVVNDEPIFCRGVCWTPQDSLRLHTTPERYREVIAKLKAAGMNLLRVGGTMVYEDDAFHDACDAAGVMVWQDLMFANMDFPGDDAAFVAEVDAEVSQQLTRLQARPSLVLVCGNSEVSQQAAMSGAARELWQPPLFEQHLRSAVAEHLGAVPYWPSSAHGGAFPFQPAAGTASYYGVGAYQRELDDAQTSGLRFASECLAFANIPDAAALDRIVAADQAGSGIGVGLRVHQPAWKARVPRDLGAGWDFDDVRDHYVERLFGVRAEALRHSDPARYLALGRAASAEAMHAAFTRWRSAGSVCGGALVWFLRDLWPGAGWGVLDDEGHPKAAFHALARVLQPLHLGITDDGLNGLNMHAVNESAEPVHGELELALYQHGERLLACERRALLLAPRSVTRHSVVDWLPGFIDVSWAYRFGPRAADLLVATLHGADGRPLFQALHAAPATMAASNGDIGLQAEAALQPDGNVRLRVRSRAAAYGVHFEVHGWRASDEFFHLPPGGEREVRFEPVGSVSGARRAWRASVNALNAREAAVVGVFESSVESVAEGIVA